MPVMMQGVGSGTSLSLLTLVKGYRVKRIEYKIRP
jgi:hypothetical protein